MISLENTIKFKLSVFIWLIILTIMVFTIIIVGGLTRLTDSGLSMVDWRPILGIIPPLSKEDWINVFDLYKQTPEYIYVNNTFTIDEFKYIFWWEWGHRVIARLLGVIFFIPLIYFIYKKYINIFLIKRLTLVFIFGIFQALVGWWMVKSGLSDNPYVSPYRLTFHLINALIIFSVLFWLCLEYYYINEKRVNYKLEISEILIFLSIILTIITIISGGFMAGTNAGQSFNTFPLMNGNIIPEDYYLSELGIFNFFENIVAINFNHRWLALITFIYTLFYFSYSALSNKKKVHVFFDCLVIFLLIIQFSLGILTLLSNVNINYASLHQTNSVLLLSSLLFNYHQYKINKQIIN